MRSRRSWVAGAALALLTTSCTTLPNVEPFVALTASVHQGVGGTGDVVEAELRSFPAGATFADRFQAEWQARTTATAALVQYSLAVQAVTAAGRHGEDAVEDVVGAAETLAATIKLSPPGQLLSVATDAGAFILGQFAAARAKGELKDALAELQPAIRRMAGILERDLDGTGDLLLAVAERHRVDIDLEYQVRLGFRERQLRRQSELYRVASLSADQARELAEITVMLQGTEAWYRDYLARVDAVDERMEAGRDVIGGAARAVSNWANAHEALVAAVTAEEERLRIPELLGAALDLEERLGRFKALLR